LSSEIVLDRSRRPS